MTCSTALELVDMGGIERGGTVNGEHSVLGQCAGKIVGRQNPNRKLRVTLLFLAIRRDESLRVRRYEVFGRNFNLTLNREKSGSFSHLRSLCFLLLNSGLASAAPTSH